LKGGLAKVSPFFAPLDLFKLFKAYEFIFYQRLKYEVKSISQECSSLPLTSSTLFFYVKGQAPIIKNFVAGVFSCSCAGSKKW
tara:strand:- start:1028 stop:1276 length:249 start_codon:yes stop_codon:yes gene_type:complete